MSRRKSRIIAFQGLYSWDVGGMSQEDILQLDWVNAPGPEEADNERERQPLDEESAAFSRMLISGTIENVTKIDETIKAHLSNWDFDRVNRVSIAILRMSVYSLMFTKDIDSSIIIDEAIDIAKNYGPDDSYKFVNAILDNIKKSLS
ncbi:MAG: transcription antitermination factor NusB [Treponema sp.]|nr:transcription antitermination factor NusB [Treponema sp.]